MIMKTSIWATCPKCQSELKIETDETELVQIECPDCYKVFAAKVPPRTAPPPRDMFAQAPILPPFQPAHVHYRSQPRRPQSRHSDDSLHPAALTAIIVICAGAILLPLGFGAYYVYGKLTENTQLSMGKETSSSTTNSVSSSPANASHTATGGITARRDFTPGTSMPAQSPVQSPSGNPALEPEMAPQANSPSMSFPVPELNPPPIIRPESSPQTSNPSGSPDAPMNSGGSDTSPAQITVTGSGTEQSGLSKPMQRFAGPHGVLIFVLHSRSSSLSMAELTRALSVQDSFVERREDHTTIGLQYSGSLDSVVKQIQFGQVSYVDEDSRSIHVQAN